MSHPNIGKFLTLAASVVFMVGCATTPKTSAADQAIASDFSDSSLEVLFATEFPVASKDEAMAKASLAYRDGELNKAQFYLVRALKFDVTDANVLTQIGNLHLMQNNAVLAARSFNFALQQDPQHAEALEGLGLLHFRDGNSQKAERMLQLAVDIDNGLWRAHNALGVMADRKSDFELALNHYNTALAAQPQSDSVRINRGYSMFLNKLYREAALDFYEVANRSGNPKAIRNLAMVYAHQGWYKSALETYLDTLDPAAAHNEVGSIATKNGDFVEAWYFLNEAVRLSPTYFADAEKNIVELRRRSPSQDTELAYSSLQLGR